MSGHSKWANIRVKKGAQDAKRGKVFTRHARLIEIAARSGGGDASSNASLRTAVDNAKADSVPNANIERAIKKGTGDLKGEQMQEMVYEAYGPGGTAFIIECLSDNRNRTAASVRQIVSKAGGRMAESGSVAYQFERKGLVLVDIVNGSAWSEDLELELIDAGAEDIQKADEGAEIVTSASSWSKVRDVLTEKGFEIISAGLSMVPKQKVPVDEEIAGKVARLMEAIEEDDDVSQVYTNADV
ncbi:MAG: protein yeeN [Candidatus Peribacteria bacterium]|nr:protein yeeN [Candidatus Peribacteria bacterium]